MKSFGAESYKFTFFLAESGLIQVSNSSFGRAFSSEDESDVQSSKLFSGLVD